MLKHQGKRFRIIEHEADIGLEVYGKEQAGLFRNAAYALFSLITDPDPIEAGFTRHITITTTDGGELLVVFLNELLYLWATENFIPRNLSVVVEGERLEADVTGEVFDPGKHLIYREIKAVTYHKFTIHQEGDRLRATIFLDI